ncbi:hypothetical protein DERF_002849 [Dermatophagoides farinae]|uniref:Uncharacterized protein n=1 Tax=Dermatophagoides farinae TaxID=6954 RepID=A0A922LA09_DERFA|nr:hypothetical protein DERF_002849 [Dermatophagoides farinae]
MTLSDEITFVHFLSFLSYCLYIFHTASNHYEKLIGNVDYLNLYKCKESVILLIDGHKMSVTVNFKLSLVNKTYWHQFYDPIIHR